MNDRIRYIEQEIRHKSKPLHYDGRSWYDLHPEEYEQDQYELNRAYTKHAEDTLNEMRHPQFYNPCTS